MAKFENPFFVLGGGDAEMECIAALLSVFGIRWVQPNKGWGSHRYTPEQVGVAIATSDRASARATMAGRPVTVVFVECQPSADGWHGVSSSVEVVDHHDEESHRPPAVRQVVNMLECWDKLSPTLQRWVEIVGANDAGYIPAMLALGATPAEVAQVRGADRCAQGITPAHEREAERALGEAESRSGGRITVIRMAHSKCAAVTDRLHPGAGGVGYENLLVVSDDGETNFYGDGALCAAIAGKFPGGWSGGSGLGKVGEPAYWGGHPKTDELLSFIEQQLTSTAA